MSVKTSVMLNPISHKNLDDILVAYPNEKTFLFSAGVYEITKQIDIYREGIRFIGLTGDAKDIHIHQKTINENGINVLADNFSINYISIHVEEGEGVCLAHSGANWSTIENCHFYGSNINFTIYFAGPQLNAGVDTINGFLEDKLDMHNVFDNNVVYTKWEGDALSFSLQKFGSVRDNVVRGGKIAIYMVKDCLITNNIITNSAAHGIICSLPSHNLKVTDNYIYKSVSGGITVRLQVEHGEFINENHNILISGNKIDESKYIGIEINNASNVDIINNRITSTKDFAVYVLKSKDIKIKNNYASEFKRGVFADIACKEVTIENNSLFSVYPLLSEHAIVLEQDPEENPIVTNNNSILNNKISGEFSSSTIKNTTIDPTGLNIETKYHSYYDEIININ